MYFITKAIISNITDANTTPKNIFPFRVFKCKYWFTISIL